jgi:hypothetical protein
MVYLEITLSIEEQNRGGAAEVYQKYKAPFLQQISGAKSKELLIRNEDVQVLHGFESSEQANNYLQSSLFTRDVVSELSPYLTGSPDIRIYESM